MKEKNHYFITLKNDTKVMWGIVKWDGPLKPHISLDLSQNVSNSVRNLPVGQP